MFYLFEYINPILSILLKKMKELEYIKVGGLLLSSPCRGQDKGAGFLKIGEGKVGRRKYNFYLFSTLSPARPGILCLYLFDQYLKVLKIILILSIVIRK